MQSSTEVSTLADEFSSTVTVSDKVVSSTENTAASQKVSTSDNHQSGSWPRAEDEAAGRNLNPVKSRLLSDVDSEGTCIYFLMCRELIFCQNF